MDQEQNSQWWRNRNAVIVVFAVWILILVSIIVDDIRGQQEISFWEWVGVLVIPVVLAAGASLLTNAQAQREITATHLRAQDEALQQYLEQVSKLLVEHKLQGEAPSSDVYKLVAQAHTLALLLKLDRDRKRQPLKLIAQLQLIDRHDPLLSLKNAGLNDADLHEVTLLNVSLREADLRLADLTGANLRDSDLRWADLRGADLRRAVLTDVCLEHANLLPYDLDNPAQLNAPHLLDSSDPSLADMTKRRQIPTMLNGKNLTITKLNQANLQRADLSDAFLYRANLEGTDLPGADLRSAYLRGANLRGANLRGADLSNADLTDADLKGARYDAETSWPEGFTLETSGAVAN